MKEFYIYVYLDTRHSGIWTYKDKSFDFRPFYVGKGKRYRINQHLQAKQRSDGSLKSNKINSIIRETGKDPMRIKVYESLSFKKANQIEIDMISHFGRIDIKTGILANMTDGGEGFKRVIFSEATKKKMSLSAKGTKTYANNGMSKIVHQYDLNGDLLNVFQSLREASESIGKGFKNISGCCRGKTKTAYGYKWSYAGKSYTPKIKPQAIDRRKKVYQYELDGTFIREWESASTAQTTTGFRHISCTCLGKFNFSGGFQWSYTKLEQMPNLVVNNQGNVSRYMKS